MIINTENQVSPNWCLSVDETEIMLVVILQCMSILYSGETSDGMVVQYYTIQTSRCLDFMELRILLLLFVFPFLLKKKKVCGGIIYTPIPLIHLLENMQFKFCLCQKSSTVRLKTFHTLLVKKFGMNSYKWSGSENKMDWNLP